MFWVLNTLGQRSRLLEPSENPIEPKLIITGDIGCYTLATYPPLNAMDTTACMGASIGQALGMEKAGLDNKVVAVIGDSTFMHSGITGLVNAVYNQGHITIIILDNGTTAMTGHQEHPGTGVSAQGIQTTTVDIERLARGIGINDVKVLDAFNLKKLRNGLRDSLNRQEVSVIIVRGNCAVRVSHHETPRYIDAELCVQCNVCLQLGCPAIQTGNGQVCIDSVLCMGDACTICQQVCPTKAIKVEGGVEAA
jgi:indolepyruvate ferredoxin oxidoreductase alpha subunit